MLTLALEAMSAMLVQQNFDLTLEASLGTVRIVDASYTFPLPLVQLAGDQGNPGRRASLNPCEARPSLASR